MFLPAPLPRLPVPPLPVLPVQGAAPLAHRGGVPAALRMPEEGVGGEQGEVLQGHREAQGPQRQEGEGGGGGRGRREFGGSFGAEGGEA